MINAEDILSKSWVDNAALFVMPGGRSMPYSKKLNGPGNDIIKSYVQNGDFYLEICANAYYGASFVEFDKNGPQEILTDR